MSLDPASLVGALTRAGLLDEARLAAVGRDLLPRARDARALTDEMVRRGWLTTYQADRLLAGRPEELLLGQYVVLEKLGEGGMGQVLEVRHRGLDRVQVVKLIRPALLGSPQALLRFQREARAAARLAHPNIVTVYDAGLLEGSGVPFLALEYVAGTDLHQQVMQAGPLPAARACEYVRQAALGLQHAHERGLIHRDIKPSNLLLAPVSVTPLPSGERGGGEGLVKVADFGLASVSGTGAGGSGPLTAEGTVLGTPDYMAPEQALRAGAVDGRADVYSLGCTLYFLLTGRPPFPGGSAAQKLLAHQQTEPVDPSHFRPDLPAGLPAVVRRMLAKRPEDRCQTAAEVAALLAPFCGRGQESLDVPPTVEIDSQATPTITPEELPPPRRRPGRKRLAVVVLLAGVLLALVVWLANRPGDRVENGPPAPQEPGAEARPVAAGERFAWQPKELVAVLGTHRWRHWGPVNCVAISPDGKLLASGGQDNVVHLWDLTSEGWSPRDRVLKAHKDAVASLAFSPDGKTLASGGLDAMVGLWDVETGKNVGRLNGVRSVKAVAFGGNNLLAAAGEDPFIRLWDLDAVRGAAPGKGLIDNYKYLLRGHEGAVRALAFSRDGKTLTSGGVHGAILRWDLSGNGEPAKKELTHRKGAILCLAHCPGQDLLVVGDEQSLELVDGTGTVLAPLQGHKGVVFSLAFSPDGRTLATASADSDIRLWELRDKQLKSKAILRGSFSGVRAVAFDPRDARVLASGGEDGVVRRWDTLTGRQRSPGPGHAAPVRTVAFSPDRRYLVSGGNDRKVRLWRVATGQGEELPGESDAVRAVAFSPDGKRLAAGDTNGVIFLWDIAAAGKPGGPVRMERKDNQAVHALAFAPDSHTLAVGGSGTDLEFWDTRTLKITDRLPGHGGDVWAAAFTSRAAGARVATVDGGSEDLGRLRVWPWPVGGRPPEVFTGPRGGMRVVAFSPDGKSVASAGADNRVRVWRLGGEDRPVLECAAQTGYVQAVACTPDGRLLISADESGQVVFWDAASGAKRHSWQFPGAVYGLAVAADGRLLATANSNGTVYVLRLPDRPAD